MKLKLFGGVLLILGTCIGAGLLALPVATANEGFITSVFMLIGVWMAMTAGAFLLLEANLWLPENANLISMARKTLGKKGEFVTWLSYLLLLYALLCAYIAVNSDMVTALLAKFHFAVPLWLSAIAIIFILGTIVFRGIYSVDIVNRALMMGKIAAYAILIVAIMPHVSLPRLQVVSTNLHISTIMVIVTSFGFAIILPSLRSYYKSDVKLLRRAILIGSIIPLIFYILWIAVVHGVIPLHGQDGLLQMLKSHRATSDLANTLSHTINNGVITSLVNLFVSICAITSFLGVSLALSDFLADGLKLQKKGGKVLVLFVATFLPPLVITLVWPGAFIEALSYAGIFVIIILMLLPAAMVYAGRYHKHLAKESDYRVSINKYALLVIMVFGVALIAWSLV